MPQAAVLLAEVGDFIRPEKPPFWVQDLVFPPAALIGRWLGFRARYPKYTVGAGV